MKHLTCPTCLSYLMECVKCRAPLSYHRSYRVSPEGPSHWEGECREAVEIPASAGPNKEASDKVVKPRDIADGEEIFRVSFPTQQPPKYFTYEVGSGEEIPKGVPSYSEAMENLRATPRDHGISEEAHEIYSKRLEDY